jgi:hypothetical protein
LFHLFHRFQSINPKISFAHFASPPFSFSEFLTLVPHHF